jgi:hypothetical protein
MTATNALSTAILKRRYQAGVSQAQFSKFPVIDEVEKRTDFNGDDYAIAIETESPQGLGADIPAAQAAAAQSKFYRAVITRKEYYGVVRIKGQALRTATLKGDAALVDLWTHELDGIEMTILKHMECLAMGSGNGVLGTISSGSSTTQITLTVAEDVNKFAVGMPVHLVNDTTLSPTVRAVTGANKITAVDRANGKLTLAAAWTSTFAGATDGDSIVRAGDAAVGGENTVPAGWLKWLEGGSSPGTWKSLARNDDPVRLASQVLDMTGLPMAEAIIDLESLIQIQGHEPKLRLVCNPRDVRQVKKTLYGKVAFSSGGGTPTIGFDGANWNGNNGTITTLQSPFCTKNTVTLKRMDKFALYSAGPAPMPMNFGKENMITLATDDAAEARIGFYGEFGESAMVESARGTGWGAV